MHSNKLYRVARAAQKVGIQKTTIHSAIERGEIPTYNTACDLPLVKLSDIREWIDNKPNRPVGRKPSSNRAL